MWIELSRGCSAIFSHRHWVAPFSKCLHSKSKTNSNSRQSPRSVYTKQIALSMSVFCWGLLTTDAVLSGLGNSVAILG